MPTFEIKSPDGKVYEVQAPDQEAAWTAFQGMTSEQEKAIAQARARRRRTEAQSGNTLEVELPDGAIAEFPSDMSRDEIKRVLASRYPKQGNASPADGPAYPVGFTDVWTDEMLFGFPSKAAAGMNALIRAPFTDKSISEEYSALRDQWNRGREDYANQYPGRNIAATLGGSIMGGGAMMKAGATASRLVPQGVTGLKAAGSNILANAADGAAYGAVSALGHDQDIAQGAGIGAALGGLSYPLVQAGRGAYNAIGGMLGVGNQSRAQSAVAEALMRSGMDETQVAAALDDAARAGQGEYMVADALGHSGQRMLSGVARAPGDMRQTIAETLQNRQMGQGDRLVNALSEGFGAPQTASRTAERLTAARASDAARNYGAARSAAGTIDPTEAIRLADDFLQPGASRVFQNAANIADDSVEGAVRRARQFLTDGKSVIRDFSTAHRAKMELDSMIEGAKPTVQRVLIPIRNALDESLSAASPEYASARNAFRTQSRVIDAIDTGKGAASARTRAADNIREFGAMTPDQQKTFRVGYADPIIARVEAAASSPATNKARMLQTGKTAQEFPAFAAPGQADMLSQRIAREQRMFETANAALGGSRTADNLADLGEMAAFDPSMIGSIATGNVKAAIIQALTKGSNALQGRNSQTRDLIARTLIQNSPSRAAAELAKAVQTGRRLTKVEQQLARGIIGGSIPLAGGAFD